MAVGHTHILRLSALYYELKFNLMNNEYKKKNYSWHKKTFSE